jgi:hypothetical protein
MAKSPFQFSIRLLLAFVAAIGLSLGAIVGEPGKVSSTLLLFMLMAIPATAIVGIIHSDGYLRAFFIGLFVPSSLGLVVIGHLIVSVVRGMTGQDSVQFVYYTVSVWGGYRTAATLVWSLALATGVSCAACRWLLDKET